MKQNTFGSSTESKWGQKSQSEWHRHNMTVYKVSCACHCVRESEAWGFCCADLYHSLGLKVLYRVIILWEPLSVWVNWMSWLQPEACTIKAVRFAIWYVSSEPVCRTPWYKFSAVNNHNWWKDDLLTNQFPGKHNLKPGATVYFLKGVLCRRLPFSRSYLLFTLFPPQSQSIAHLKRPQFAKV